jgi:hypothetical protein
MGIPDLSEVGVAYHTMDWDDRAFGALFGKVSQSRLRTFNSPRKVAHMYPSIRFQFGAALMLASLATLARAGIDGSVVEAQLCTGEYRVVFQAEGRAAQSAPVVRQQQVTNACASTSPNPLVLTVFTDAAGGAVLLSGSFDAAIEQIKAVKRVSAVRSLNLSNLCVAQIVARDWLEARGTCDAAVEAARLDRAGAPAWPMALRDRYREFQAVAYSNRAVLSILAQDMTAGESDLMHARKSAPRATFVKRNIEANRVAQEARVAQRTLPAG